MPELLYTRSSSIIPGWLIDMFRYGSPEPIMQLKSKTGEPKMLLSIAKLLVKEVNPLIELMRPISACFIMLGLTTTVS